MKVNYEKIKKDRNLGKAFINYIGFVTTDVSDGYARGEIELNEMHGNPIGSVHGGVLFAMADTVGGIAATTKGSSCTTVSGNISYLNPAIGCRKLIGEGRVKKAGHNLAVVDVDIMDENNRIIASSVMTYHYFWDKMPFPFIEKDGEEE